MESIKHFIAKARENLLDLSYRNRLLNCSLDSNRVIRVYHDNPDLVFEMLVNDNKSMKFLPGRDSAEASTSFYSDESEVDLKQPDDDDTDVADIRRNDSYLKTKITSAKLQTRLLRMYTEAQTVIDWSDWLSLQRVMEWLLQFIKNIKTNSILKNCGATCH